MSVALIDQIPALSFGAALIPQEKVLSAVDAIVQRATPFFFDLIKNKEKCLRNGPPTLTELVSPYSSLPSEGGLCVRWSPSLNNSLSIFLDSQVGPTLPQFPSFGGDLGEYFIKAVCLYSEESEALQNTILQLGMEKIRCYVRLFLQSNELQPADPLDSLLMQVYGRLTELGCEPDGEFDVRLERGYLPQSAANGWHFDQTATTSVTVCYSNRENWSTRVVDLQKGGQIRAEEFSEPAQMDFFYDALKVFHRAPELSDLDGQYPSPTDYRLFIRYRTFEKPDKPLPLKPAKPAPFQDILAKAEKFQKPLKSEFSSLNVSESLPKKSSFLAQVCYKPLDLDLFRPEPIEIKPLSILPADFLQVKPSLLPSLDLTSLVIKEDSSE